MLREFFPMRVAAALRRPAFASSSSCSPHACLRHAVAAASLPRAFSTSAAPAGAQADEAEEFPTEAAHRAFIARQARLPRGFSCATRTFRFNPRELPTMDAQMTLTCLSLDDPRGTASWAATFTKNAFPGSPVLVGRELLAARDDADGGGRLRGILANNKISNVFPGGLDGSAGGVEDAKRVAAAALAQLNQPDGIDGHDDDDVLAAAPAMLPSSTGVIGWRIPVDEMIAEMPELMASLQSESALPAAEGIMTTDMYPKVRAAEIACADGSTGRMVAIAKGAGMIEPNMATMLVFVLTDVALPKSNSDDIGSSASLGPLLRRAVDKSFNRISVDSDTSTSDTVAMLSSDLYPCADVVAFEQSLTELCMQLSDDVVRNGEGVTHVIRAHVRGACNDHVAVGVGRSIVNSPLFKCAVHGNDPNVGRLVSSIGKYFGWLETAAEANAASGEAEDASARPFDPSKCEVSIGGVKIFQGGSFTLDIESEHKIQAHMERAQLYKSAPVVNPESGDVTYVPPVTWPTHKRCVEIEVDLGMAVDGVGGSGSATVVGSSLSHEYVAENADYRS